MKRAIYSSPDQLGFEFDALPSYAVHTIDESFSRELFRGRISGLEMALPLEIPKDWTTLWLNRTLIHEGEDYVLERGTGSTSVRLIGWAAERLEDRPNPRGAWLFVFQTTEEGRVSLEGGKKKRKAVKS